MNPSSQQGDMHMIRRLGFLRFRSLQVELCPGRRFDQVKIRNGMDICHLEDLDPEALGRSELPHARAALRFPHPGPDRYR